MNKYLSKPYIPYAVAFLGAMGLQSIIALNTSETMREVVKLVSRLKQLSIEDVVNAVQANAHTFYGL